MANEKTTPAKVETPEEELARLRAENEVLKAQNKPKDKPLSFKVSEKKAVSVYGLNARFPVTLYANQWKKLYKVMDKLMQFIEDNKGELRMEKE